MRLFMRHSQLELEVESCQKGNKRFFYEKDKAYCSLDLSHECNYKYLGYCKNPIYLTHIQ